MSDTTTITPPSPPGNLLPRRPDYNDVDCAGCPERRRGYLTWGTEPPKVAGWYWCRQPGESIDIILHYHQAEGRFDNTDGRQWAGPIKEPLEPEES